MAVAVLFGALCVVLVSTTAAGSSPRRLLLQQASGPFVLPPLPYSTDALEPVIDKQTTFLHHDRHHAAYVSNLNAAVGRSNVAVVRDRSHNLTELIYYVGDGQYGAEETAIRNNGGGHWNHAFWWKILAPPGSQNTSRSNISPELGAVINSAFGSTDAMLSQLKSTADAIFGSGWAWVCAFKDGALTIVSTPNQDNPLMSQVVKSGGVKERCTPILGVDIWEHGYYLKYNNLRPQYTSAWLGIINWTQVSSNYKAAREGNFGEISTVV